MEVIFSGFLAGLSVGVFCLGFCLPIFVPYLLSQSRTPRSSFWITVEFSLGRLLGYTAFGTAVGFLGMAIESQFIHKLGSLGTISLAVVMILYSVGLLRWGPKACGKHLTSFRVPFLLGFFTGINVCPPFLLSLSYVFNLKSAALGALYFLAFFTATSLYIVPLGFLGVFSKSPVFQKIAQVSAFLTGCVFLLSGIRTLR